MKKSIFIVLLVISVVSTSFSLTWKKAYDSALVMRDAGNFDKSVELLQVSLLDARKKLTPKDSNFINIVGTLGILYYQSGNIKMAIEYCDSALTLTREAFGVDHSTYAIYLNNLGGCNLVAGNIELSGKQLQEANELFLKIYKGPDQQFADNYLNLAQYYLWAADYNNADSCISKYLNMTRQIYKGDHPNLAFALTNTGGIYSQLSRIDQAEALLREAVDMNRRLSNSPSLELARSLSSLGSLYTLMGKSTDALPLLMESVEIFRSLYTEKNQFLAEALANLGSCYYYMDRFTEAEPLIRESLRIFKEIFPGDNQTVATLLKFLAVSLESLYKYDEAEHFYDEAVRMNRRIYSGDNAEFAESLNQLALFYSKMGKMWLAGPLFEESYQMCRRIYSIDDFRLVGNLNNLANYYNNTGNNDKALEIYTQALEMNRRLFPGDHPQTARIMDNIAGVYADLGQMSLSDEYYKYAMEMRRRIYPSGSTELAMNLNNIAVSYATSGKKKEAEELYQEALSIYRKLNLGDNPDFGNTLISIAQFYKDFGEYPESERLNFEALEIFKRLYKGDHPQIVLALNNLGGLYHDWGKIDTAVFYYRESLEMNRRLANGDNQMLSRTLNNLGTFYIDIKDYKNAELYLNETLEMQRRLYKHDHPEICQTISNLASSKLMSGDISGSETLYIQANEMIRKIYKGNHPKLAEFLFNFAQFYLISHNYKKAENYYLESLKMQIDLLNKYFPLLSDKEKEYYWRTIRIDFERFNYLAMLRYKENPVILNDMLNFRLTVKGILLNATIKVNGRIKNSGDSTLINTFENWRLKKDYIAKLITGFRDGNNQVIIDSLERETNEIEKTLVKASELFAGEYGQKEFTYKDLSSHLLDGEAAVEIVRFRGIKDRVFNDTVYYAAIILKYHKNDDSIRNSIEIAIMDNSAELETSLLKKYRTLIDYQRNPPFDDDKINAHLRKFYEAFWSKIQTKLDTIKTVYISLDGVYNQINLNTLVNPNSGNYLIEELDLRVMTSLRDLAKTTPQNLIPGEKSKKIETKPLYPDSRMAKTAELFGDPAYFPDSMSQAISINRQSVHTTNRTGSNLSFLKSPDSTLRSGLSPLPGTRNEIEKLAALLSENGWNVNKHLGIEALEESVKSIQSPTLLHIASHGKFLGNESTNDINPFKENKIVMTNPLFRSMLLLTGAGNSILKVTTNSTPNEDGILTSYEAMNLNLDNTEIVVLSACETGLGEIKNGEGVYGLQRAFQVAGAKAIIMSLWSVNDEATQQLMISFYSKWLGGKEKRAAFREAQMELKKKRPGFYYWGAFVMLGE